MKGQIIENYRGFDIHAVKGGYIAINRAGFALEDTVLEYVKASIDKLISKWGPTHE